MARLFEPPLTTIRFDRKAVGRTAFDVLERMSAAKLRKGTKSLVETSLIVRSSTAAANRNSQCWRPDSQ
jgi:DNA-binding LacI/PurR family transcriptional regulator